MSRSSILKGALTLLVYAFYACVLGMSLAPSLGLLLWALQRFLAPAIAAGGFPAIGSLLVFSLFLGASAYLFFFFGLLLMGCFIRLFSLGIKTGQTRGGVSDGAPLDRAQRRLDACRPPDPAPGPDDPGLHDVPPAVGMQDRKERLDQHDQPRRLLHDQHRGQHGDRGGRDHLPPRVRAGASHHPGESRSARIASSARTPISARVSPSGTGASWA